MVKNWPKSNFEEINEKLYDSNWKSQFLSGLMFPMMGFIGNLSYVAVCVVGAALVTNGTISFGVIVAFMVYVRNCSHSHCHRLHKLQQTYNPQPHLQNAYLIS